MKIKLFFIITLLFSLNSCVSSFKNNLISKGNSSKEIAIYNAILDFSNKNNLYKKDSVFSVNFHNEIYTRVLHQIENGVSEWKRDKLHEGIVGVTILPSYYKFPKNQPIRKDLIPSRYVVIKNKLFYWWDDNYALTDETLSILYKFNLIREIDDSMSLFDDDFAIDDRVKGVHYYFCRNDFSKYVKIITSIGFGYYDIPDLKNCQ